MKGKLVDLSFEIKEILRILSKESKLNNSVKAYNLITRFLCITCKRFKGKCWHFPRFGIHCILEETASYKYVPVLDTHDRKQVTHLQLNCRESKILWERSTANLGSRSDYVRHPKLYWIEHLFHKGLVINDHITRLYSYTIYIYNVSSVQET